MSNDGTSIRDFASQIGKSHVWVLKLVQAGAIPKNADGTIPMKAGLTAYRNYIENKAQAKAAKKAAKQNKPPKQKEDKPAVNPAPVEIKTAAVPAIPKIEQASNISAAMNKAKLAETTFKARLRELEYKVKNGELLSVDEVSNEAQWLAEQVKSKLQAIPPRISGMCEGRIAREIEEIITDAINGALKELQKCKYQSKEE